MKVIITGGAGFIGCNAAARALKRGDEPVVIDNLSRPGTELNLNWLHKLGLRHFLRTDLRNARETQLAIDSHQDASLVLHLAGQVAVTTSVADPRLDFEGNALATFNVLEAMRLGGSSAPLFYASTNKVYGGMEDLEICMKDGRYGYAHQSSGISEERGLDFHSPYGCSKGAADQYVRDYFRIYGIPTVVFRQSCIYGYNQWGMEDQGWVAWFMIATRLGRPIKVYGDGRQVRDLLFIEDLLDAYDAALRHIDVAAGKVYNLGGGPRNVLSLLELLDFLGQQKHRPVEFDYASWRPGDQRVYISNIERAGRELGWHPKVSCRNGLHQLYDWIEKNVDLFESLNLNQYDQIPHFADRQVLPSSYGGD
jgi:CDP-paratose 2-epimerase